jgi:hypothetical protein
MQRPGFTTIPKNNDPKVNGMTNPQAFTLHLNAGGQLRRGSGVCLKPDVIEIVPAVVGIRPAAG